jgi:phosphoesterase RecJ-like protein
MYGDINWYDESASACGELVFTIIQALGVPLTQEIATHIYLAILTDTGSFHHSNITPRTFDICRQVTEAGVNPASMARRVFDSNSFGKLKLIGHLLDSMQMLDNGRLASICLTQDMLDRADSTVNDTEGIINLPLTAREIQAVVFFKALEPGLVRVSMRSKYDVDVRSVAVQYGGGGHKNAAGFAVPGKVSEVRGPIVEKLLAEIERATSQRDAALEELRRA